jgi:hypothetical protein
MHADAAALLAAQLNSHSTPPPLLRQPPLQDMRSYGSVLTELRVTMLNRPPHAASEDSTCSTIAPAIRAFWPAAPPLRA